MLDLKKLLVVVLTSVFFISSTGTILAQEDPKPNFTVTTVESKIGKIGEKINLLLRFNKVGKVDYYSYLLEKRLAELAFVVESNDHNMVEEAASRYTTYIGIVSNFTKNKQVSEKKDDLLKQYERHGKVLEKLQSRFAANSGWWLAMQHTINSTRDFSEQLKSL